MSRASARSDAALRQPSAAGIEHTEQHSAAALPGCLAKPSDELRRSLRCVPLHVNAATEAEQRNLQCAALRASMLRRVRCRAQGAYQAERVPGRQEGAGGTKLIRKRHGRGGRARDGRGRHGHARREGRSGVGSKGEHFCDTRAIHTQGRRESDSELMQSRRRWHGAIISCPVWKPRDMVAGDA